MARGMVVGEGIVSQAQSKAFDEGYARIYGERKPTRGRWVYDTRQGKCVPAAGYIPPSEARTAPVMVDRFMEGERAPDGTPIGNRRARRDWMNASGAADYSDFNGIREKAAKEAAAKARGEIRKDPALREFIGRQLYRHKIIG